MNDISIIVSIIVGVCTVIGIVFSAFWAVITGIEKRAKERMDSIENENKIDHDIIFEKANKNAEDIGQRVTYTYAESIYVRKELHNEQYGNLMSMISNMNLKIDKILTEVKTK